MSKELTKSMEQKIKDNDKLAVEIGYKYQLDKGIELTENENSLVWKLIDFGYTKELNIMDGKCSIASLLSLNMEAWEQQIIKDYDNLLKIKNRILETIVE